MHGDVGSRAGEDCALSGASAASADLRAAVDGCANSDLRLNSYLHTIFLDGVYSPDGDGKG